MPEIITTPNALVQTTNGKRFYCFSGNIGVPDSDTTMIDINNIGERDMKIAFEIGKANTSADDYALEIYTNDILVYETYLHYGSNSGVFGWNELKLVLPANTSLKVTLVNRGSSTSRLMNIACYGKYLSM